MSEESLEISTEPCVSAWFFAPLGAGVPSVSPPPGLEANQGAVFEALARIQAERASQVGSVASRRLWRRDFGQFSGLKDGISIHL